MRTLNLEIEAETADEIVNTLRQILSSIEEGYTHGITFDGTCWALEGEDEESEEDEE